MGIRSLHPAPFLAAGEPAATVFGVVFLTTTILFSAYLMGALASALSGTRTGPLAKIGLGLLGMLVATPVLLFVPESAPPILTWVASVSASAGSVVLLRRILGKRRVAEAPPV